MKLRNIVVYIFENKLVNQYNRTINSVHFCSLSIFHVLTNGHSVIEINSTDLYIFRVKYKILNKRIFVSFFLIVYNVKYISINLVQFI